MNLDAADTSVCATVRAPGARTRNQEPGTKNQEPETRNQELETRN